MTGVSPGDPAQFVAATPGHSDQARLGDSGLERSASGGMASLQRDAITIDHRRVEGPRQHLVSMGSPHPASRCRSSP